MTRKPKFKIHRSDNDRQWYFVLCAPNGKIILQSEGYTTKRKLLNGIRSIIKNAPIAEVQEDL